MRGARTTERGGECRKFIHFSSLGPKSVLIPHLHPIRNAKILNHGTLILFNGKKMLAEEASVPAEEARSLARGLSHLRNKYIQWQQGCCQVN